MGAGAIYFSDNWRSNFERALAELKKLPEGSDSWVPHRPSDEMLAVANQLASNIKRKLPTPIVVAATDGTIQIKWQKAGYDISIFVYSDCTLEFMINWLNSGDRKVGELSIDQVGQLLAEF